jgi:NAD(P)-dependent dehydrogenase (short-subunit alcohol dehydrogenase family)
MDEGSICLVVGGSGGIGSAICIELANNGIRPVVSFNQNGEKAGRIADRTEGLSVKLDLRDDSSIDNVVEFLTTQNQPVSGIIVAASPPPELVPFGKITKEDMTLQWQVNVAGPQRLIAGLIKTCMRKNKAGTVFAILSSAMGLNQQNPASHMSAYIIAKFGLLGVLNGAKADYPWLTVNSISPSFVETPMLMAFDSRYLELMREKQADGKFSTPKCVAEEVLRIIKK